MRLLKFSPHVGGVEEAVGSAIRLVQSSPATWQSAFAGNVLIFLLGSPILASGLTLSGVVSAFVLGTLTWRAFGSSGFLLVAAYFILVSPFSVIIWYSILRSNWSLPLLVDFFFRD